MELLKKLMNDRILKNKPVKTSFVCTIPMAKANSANLMAYHPSFTSNTQAKASAKQQLNVVKSKLDKESQIKLNRLAERGILTNNSSNDGSTVLDNLYKIATEPRIMGLSAFLLMVK